MTFSKANSHLNRTSAPSLNFWSDNSLGCPPAAHPSAASAFSRVKFICNANIFSVRNGVSTIRRVRLRQLGCINLGKNSTNYFADFGSNARANHAVPVEKDENGAYGNGPETLDGINRGRILGCTNLEKSDADLSRSQSNTTANPAIPVGKDENGAYGNGSETLDGLNRGRILGCTNLEKNDADLSRFQSNTTANPASAAEKEASVMVGNGSATLEETDDDIGSGQGLRGGLEASPANDSDKQQSESLAINKKIYSPYIYDPLKSKKDNGLLDEEELEKLKILENYEYRHSFEHGLFVVKAMGTEHMKDTEELLTDSFAELMWGPLTYRPLLRLTLREHMLERRAFIPHAATLVGLYAEGQSKWMLAGAVELSFNSKGSLEFPPTPIPPKGAPYLCNMAVNKNLRRRGIGWHLLKASEQLLPKMGSSEIYLHCRMVDTAPFNMYKKAGYNVVETDNVLIILTLQRRRHLMYKKLLEPT